MSNRLDAGLRVGAFWKIGHDLTRPENVIAERSGDLWIADAECLIRHIDSSGIERRMCTGTTNFGTANGIALLPDHTFIVAMIDSGVFVHVTIDGEVSLLAACFEGEPLGAPNFVEQDRTGGLWLSVSTRTTPRRLALESGVRDGYILHMNSSGVLGMAANGIAFANEVRVSPDGMYLYVAESAIGAVSRYPILQPGKLGNKESVGPCPIFDGAKIDGITFDEIGNLWMTEITKNAILVMSPTGLVSTFYEDPDGSLLNFPTSITFASNDLRTLLIGSLKSNYLTACRVSVAGLAPHHWK